jgi:hypothetical protein
MEYKTKLEELYDLCRVCKNKLKLHLANLDREIGISNSMSSLSNNNNNYNSHSKFSIIQPFNNATNMFLNGCNQIKNNFKSQSKTGFVEIKNNVHLNTIKKSKANTIAGTIGSYIFETRQQAAKQPSKTVDSRANDTSKAKSQVKKPSTGNKNAETKVIDKLFNKKTS